MRKRGFTLVEVLVTTVLVAVAVVAVMSGIRALSQADVKARDAETLQRLAAQKLDALYSVDSLDDAETEGTFEDQGYPDIKWELEVEPSGTDNVQRVTVTATMGEESQALSALVYVRPATGSTQT